MTQGHQFLVSISVALAVLFGLSLLGYQYWEPTEQAPSPLWMMASAESEPAELTLCMDTTTRERVRTIMYEALDEALKDHIMKMYEVWMRDDRGQPGRASTGARQGVKAYLGARQAVDKWEPNPCPG